MSESVFERAMIEEVSAMYGDNTLLELLAEENRVFKEGLYKSRDMVARLCCEILDDEIRRRLK